MDWVVRLALVMVGGQEAQCSEGPRVVLARVGGWEAETRHGDLRVSGWLRGTCRTALSEGGLCGAGALGQSLGGGCGLWGVGRSLPTVRLLRGKEIQSFNWLQAFETRSVAQSSRFCTDAFRGLPGSPGTFCRCLGQGEGLRAPHVPYRVSWEEADGEPLGHQPPPQKQCTCGRECWVQLPVAAAALCLRWRYSGQSLRT